MAILRKLPAAVAVAALTATLVGCGSNEVRDERDEARMERDAALAAQAAAEQARMAAEAAKTASDAAAAEEDAARMAAEEERDMLQAEEERRAADQMAQAMREMEARSRVLYEALGDGGVVATTLDGLTMDRVTATAESIRWDHDEDTATDALKLGRTMTPATMMGSWTGAEYDREVLQPGANPSAEPAVTDTAMVYTNQGAPSVDSQPFAKKHGDLLELDTAQTFIGNNNLGVVANRRYIASPEFAVGSGTRSHDVNAGSELRGTHFFETKGTFDGAPGIYRCIPNGNTSCSSAVHGSDGILLGGGTWRFTPDADAMTSTPVSDEMYVAYGWWLRDSVEEGTEFGTFTDSVGIGALSTGFTALQGSATYMGHAAGQYALLPGLENPTGDAGSFTANVMLEADWGGDTTVGTLSGTVDGFMGADGMPRDWTVTLMPDALETSGDLESGGDTRWTIGGVAADLSGTWDAQLYESSTPADGRTNTPKNVVGEFATEHATAVGRMVGAFGAELQPVESP